MSRSFRDLRQRLLWQRAKRGHAPSFRRLYEELAGPVLRYLVAKLGNGADAEDVASEVFRRFVVGLERYDPARGSLHAWVFCMAHSALVDHLRRQRPTEPLDAITATLADGAGDGLALLIADEEARFAHGLLRGQAPEVREMFSLHFAHGLSYREIAVTLGMTEAAVKQRFARTLRRLRQELRSRPASRSVPGTVTDAPSTG